MRIISYNSTLLSIIVWKLYMIEILIFIEFTIGEEGFMDKIRKGPWHRCCRSVFCPRFVDVFIQCYFIEHCVTLFLNCITLFINPITLFEHCKTIIQTRLRYSITVLRFKKFSLTTCVTKIKGERTLVHYRWHSNPDFSFFQGSCVQ